MAGSSLKRNRLVVESVTQEGRRFRPSDWIERISTTLATFGRDGRLRYSDAVQPRMINGGKCLVIKQSLQQDNPEAYRYILSFVEANNLRSYEE